MLSTSRPVSCPRLRQAASRPASARLALSLLDDRIPDVRHGPDPRLRQFRGPVHQPGQHVPVREIAPEDVRSPVAVEVARTDDVRGRARHADVKLALRDGAVHRSGADLPDRLLPSQDVGLAVTVLIAEAPDLAVRVGHRADMHLCHLRRAIHASQPDLAARGAVAEYVALPEVREVGGTP